MKTLLDLITIEMKAAFRAAGYGEELAKVTLSNRPDLCEYQCNGAMAVRVSVQRRDGRGEGLQEGAVYDCGGRGVPSR